jgi:capsular exopolysaccharide synthesis family protein
MAEAAYKASQLPGAATAQTATDGRATGLESRLSELRFQRARLVVEYTEEAPEIIEIDKQIAVTEQEIKETRSRATNTLTTNLEIKYREALAREQDLRGVFSQQREQVVSQNEAAISYRIIQQEIATDKSLLDGLLQRSKQNDVVLSNTPNNVLIVDRAVMPRSPVGPDRLMYIALGFMTSLGLGIGLALLLNYLDDTLRTVDDVESQLHLPVLSAVPSISRSKTVLQFANSLGRKKEEAYSMSVLDLNNKSAMAEAYMHLRTSVLLATAGGPPEVFLVTSGQPGEGKTTTAINMATVLAQTGVRVLLVDADLRRPTLHTILGLNNNGHDVSKGLTSLLTAKALDDSSITGSIKFHEQSGLHVITSGPLPPNPANLLCSPQMGQLLNILRTRFTHIVIDSPPVTFFTDGVLLSRLVDGVLLVVRSGQSHLDMASHAKKLLWDAGARFFGVVLNDVSHQASNYYPYDYDRPIELPQSDQSYLKVDAN